MDTIETAESFTGFESMVITVATLFRGHSVERPPPLVRPLDNVNLNINVLIFTPNKRPPLFYAKGVA